MDNNLTILMKFNSCLIQTLPKSYFVCTNLTRDICCIQLNILYCFSKNLKKKSIFEKELIFFIEQERRKNRNSSRYVKVCNDLKKKINCNIIHDLISFTLELHT